MTTTSTRLPAEVHYCRERLQHYLLSVLPRVFDAVDDQLFALADQAQTNQDQNHYFESMREIRLRRRGIEAGVLTRVTEPFTFSAQPEAGGINTGGDDGGVSAEFKQAQFDVVATATIFRMQERVAAVLSQLSLRLSELVSIAVSDASNPFSPARLFNAFAAELRSLAVDSQTHLLLLAQFEQQVFSEYTHFLTQINSGLKRQGVLPLLEAVAPEQIGKADNAEGASRQAQARLNDLYRLLDDLQEEAITAVESTIAIEQSSISPAASSALQYKSVSLLELIEKRLHDKNLSALRLVDQDAINLVVLLFDFILDDRNLPAPMKALISHMRIPLLKIALNDQTLFNTNTHPARLLLNQVATIALGWQKTAVQQLSVQESNQPPPQDVLYAEIARVIVRLLQEFDGSLDLFDELRVELTVFSGKEQRRIAVVEQRTLDAEEGKARTEAARRQVAEALAATVAAQRVPAVVAELLQGSWSNVLFFIHLQQGENSTEWQSATQVAKDLLWSVAPLETYEERNRLILLLPDLLQRLRQGLAKIACHPAAITELLQRLEAIHLQQFTGGFADTELQSIELPIAVVSHAATDLLADGVNTAASIAQLTAQVADEKYIKLVDQLSQGNWFELQDAGGNHRCRLAAIIKNADKYIFTNRSGMKVAEKNRTQLALALQSGELRQLDDSGLFDRALESVIGNLRHAKHSL